MTLRTDHLTIIAPSLADGAAHVRNLLGVDMVAGGRHPQMGTHNLLLRLGDDMFLEVIAVDPEAEVPIGPRWFGLGDAAAVARAWDAGHRLRAWVAQTDDIDGVLGRHGEVLGQKTRVSRGDRSWLFTVPPDGSLPMDGIAPSVIDRGADTHPAPRMPDFDLALVDFSVEHPQPAEIAAFYERLGVLNPPQVRQGAQLRYRASIRTPAGLKELY